MNKRMKIIVSVLFIVIILLAVAITRFYSDTTKTTKGNSTQTDIDKKHGSDGVGNRIFEDSSGMFGIIDSSERVIVPPEWQELFFAGGGKCVAKAKQGGRQLYGGIDYEGNVIVPFVYRSITIHQSGRNTFFTALTDSDERWVVYDGDLKAAFTNDWDSCTVNGDTLELISGPGRFTYTVGSEGMAFSEAKLSGSAQRRDFDLSLNSRVLLSKVDPSMLKKITSYFGSYIDYAYTDDTEYLSDLRIAALSAVRPLFPGEKAITLKRVNKITDVVIYSVGGDDGEPGFAVSANVDSKIYYRSKMGRSEIIEGKYKAMLRFTGSSENTLRMVSAGFSPEKPEYLETAPPEGTEEKVPETKPAEKPDDEPENNDE